ncbi:MAG: hypothetical protein M0Z77_00905 [Thermoplasmatales archaeon]|nr:hypothetical protein [Thermoplasmatales archaeon]
MTGQSFIPSYEYIQGLYILGGTLIGWFLSQFRLVKPRLIIDFENGTPCIRGNIIRLKCENKGLVQAINCEAKLTIYNDKGVPVQDGHILHWSRLMITSMQGQAATIDAYHPITIASKDHEFIDFTIIVSHAISTIEYWGIYSYPYMLNGHILPLPIQGIKDSGQDEQKSVGNASNERILRAQIKVHADGTRPPTIEFYFKVCGTKIFIGRTKNDLKEVGTCRM